MAAADDFETWFDRGVTDGLPVVPPSRARVDAMLAATARPRDELVARVPPNFGRATVEKLAVNAVMSGCRPEYFPVVLAAVPHSARVVGTAGGRLLVWDCDAGTVREVPGRGRKLWRDLAAHPDGRRVAAVNNTPHVSLLDPRAAAVAVEFGPGAGPLTAVTVSPDGMLWAAAGSEGRVAVWDDDG